MKPDSRRTPAQRYARIVGCLLVLAGVVGLLFGGEQLGSSGWQDALRIAVGVLGLAAASTWARDYALGFGLLFVVLGIWGMIVGDGGKILGELPVTTAVIVGHLVLGLVGLGAGAATKPRSARPSPRRAKKLVRPRPKPRRLASASGLEDE